MIYAINTKDQKETHILDAKEGIRYHCLKCRDKLIPRQGKEMPWHFCHDENNQCILKEDANFGCIFSFLKTTPNRECKATERCGYKDCKLHKAKI